MISAVLPNLRRWLSVVLTLILLVSSGLALGGCNPTTLKTEAAQVSQIVLHSLSDPKTFNYSLKNEFPNIFPFTFEGLTFANEFTGKIEPGLAESWESFDNNRRYIFTLREGLKWSDGTPLTADDVFFSYQDFVFNPEIATDQ